VTVRVANDKNFFIFSSNSIKSLEAVFMKRYGKLIYEYMTYLTS